MMLRILHLEDDRNDVELIQVALRRAGVEAEFRVAHTHEEYLAACETDRFDLILSDSSVAGFDGETALRMAREAHPGIPFIFVCGFADDIHAREKQAKTGANACIPKAHLERLPEAVERAAVEARLQPEAGATEWYVHAMERLMTVVQELSLARDMNQIMAIVRRAARELTDADGATFVLREGDFCHYVDENAIAPMWKGQRFPLESCVSGWVMLNHQAAVIPDIYADPRIPEDAYRPTFVRSMIMVPIRTVDPLGAIGNYWARLRLPRPEEVKVLQALADCTSVAIENIRLYASLERKVLDRTVGLQALNQELDDFSYAVSHDLRAPLRHVNGYLKLLQEEVGTNLSPAATGHLTVVTEAARQMDLLIDDLLEYSRLGRMTLHKERVYMNRLVKEVREELVAATRGRSIVWFTGDLPDVTGDRMMLKQVWLNLLYNAVKFTRYCPQAEIRVGMNLRDNEMEFFVQDNGAGFEMEHAGKLFGIFQRLHPANKFEGTGIGLASVRRIIGRHGGRTSAQGKVGAGATFCFTLPLSARR